MRIAVQGCGHGTLDAIYEAVAEQSKDKGWDGVDLVIIGGDFQAVRNSFDLNAMSVPMKYRQLGDFYKYYSGEAKAPYLTVYTGGNHENSAYHFELFYGGWVAPNIYYLGAANVLSIGGLRIAGSSGIWKGMDFRKPHHERLPYSYGSVRSAYHVREWDIRKLLQLQTQVDIVLSHDWPSGIEWLGNYKKLFSEKPFFEADAVSGKLGSVAGRMLMDWLRPRFWFSAHLHCRFQATIDHTKGGLEQQASQSPYFQSDQQKPAAPPSFANPNLIGHNEVRAGTPQSSQIEVEKLAIDSPVAHEIQIDLDTLDVMEESTNGTSTSITLPSQSSNGQNAEIEVDLDDLADEEEAVQAVTSAPTKVDPPTDPSPTPASTHNGSEAQNTAQPMESAVPGDLRAQLPASFAKRAPAPPREHPAAMSNTTTDFLALDKCLPKRKFLELFEINPTEASASSEKPTLQYDPEWLAITRVFAHELVVGDVNARVPPRLDDQLYIEKIAEEKRWVDEHIVGKGLLEVPSEFNLIAPSHDHGIPITIDTQPLENTNPQTVTFCDLLRIPNPFDISEDMRAQRRFEGPPPDHEGHSSNGFSRGQRGFNRSNFRGSNHGFGRGRGGRGRGRGGRRPG